MFTNIAHKISRFCLCLHTLLIKHLGLSMFTDIAYNTSRFCLHLQTLLITDPILFSIEIWEYIFLTFNLFNEKCNTEKIII
jgi:hypothetical protein